MINENSLAAFSLNAGQRQHQIQDETIFEQIYDFQNFRCESPVNSTTSSSVLSSAIMPMITVGSTVGQSNRSFFNPNANFQLPLIEKSPSKSLTRTLTTKTNYDPLETLAQRRRRNPFSYKLPSNPEEAKRNLRALAERNPTPNLTSKASEPSAQTQQRSNSSLQSSSLVFDEPIVKPSTPPPTTIPVKKRTYTTHRLIIHRGFIQDHTEPYRHFQTAYASTWPRISTILHRLEKLMYEFTVPLAIVDGQRVVELEKTLGAERRPTVDELLATILNRNDVDIWLTSFEKSNHQRKFRRLNVNDQQRAAILIQSYWRGFRVRNARRSIQKQRERAMRVIGSACFRYLKLKKIREIQKQTQQRLLENYQRNQDEFKKNWTQLSSKPRVIVHLPSLGLPENVRDHLDELSLRENYQIGRLCDLADPNVDVIYVSPIYVTDDISQYYYRLISLRPMVEQGNEAVPHSAIGGIQERLTIVMPESLNRFPMHRMCLSTLLKYSPKTLKQIKSLINNRSAYLISSISHFDDLFISDYLNIPIYGCEPELSYLYSTKSGSKRIFRTSHVPMPFGEYDIYNEKHLLQSLTQLILDHLNIERWLFKIDDYIDGLGIAHCDVIHHLPFYQLMVKEASKYGDQWSKKEIQKEWFERIFSILPKVLAEKSVFVNKNQFDQWSSYLKIFLSHGGVIEAHPTTNSTQSVTVCLSIEPDGRHSIICSVEQIHLETKYSTWAFQCPQTSVETSKLNKICDSIIEQCQQRNIYGFVNIDLIVFNEQTSNEKEFWLIDLCIGYSEIVSMFNLFRFVTMARFDQLKNSLTVRLKENKQRLRNWQNGVPEQKVVEQNSFSMWTSKLFHSNFAQFSYSEFFQVCRQNNIGFDIRKKQGTIFTLLQGNHHEHFGLMTISDRLETVEKQFILNLKSLEHELNNKQSDEITNFKLAIELLKKKTGITDESPSS